MKKYKTIFSSFHTAYRLITTYNTANEFTLGICRLYKSVFKANKVVLVCKNIESTGFIKIRIENSKQVIKKGGISILSLSERETFEQGKQIVSDKQMTCPLFFSSIWGVVHVSNCSESTGFGEIEQRWFSTLSEEISIGLKIFHQYHEERKTIVYYTKCLTKLLDQYVPTSSLHTKCVFHLIKELGKEMRLTESEIKSLEYASLLHDAGKIQLPSKILKKQKPLTQEEYKVVMSHPRSGVELFKNLETLKPAMPIILHHHERYDGGGYPSGLKKQQIPLGARILAVIDAFDAMYYGRPYRKRMGLDCVVRELENQMGKQFDPNVVTAFLKIVRKRNFTRYLE